MKAAVPVKNKAERRPTCPHCKKRFRTTSTKAIFCSRPCKDKATADKRRIKYVEKAADSAFMKQLAFEASRAGTYEIFTGLQNAPESLAELYRLYAFKLKACQYGESRTYELSHICPAQGEDNIGLYHPQNLVVAPMAMNRAHGNAHYGAGLSIDRNKLQSRYLIEKGTKQSAIIAGIIRFIGADVVAQAVKIAGIKPRERVITLAWLRDHLDPAIEQHRLWLEGMDDMQTPALKALKLVVQGKEESGFKIETRKWSQFEVLYQELSRHAQHRPDLIPVMNAVQSFISDRLDATGCYDWLSVHTMDEVIQYLPDNFVTPVQLQGLFDVLHGASAEAFLQAVGTVPARSPVVILATLPMPTRSSPSLSFLADARSFADELDTDYVPDIPPTLLPGHTLAYEQCDPLPW
ncbi:hypothetical protein [Pseudomonas sp. VI4.1]|uniref:hypothetical protein n=1 Tax=Pseudomonas sp. VI4.1 TaxID=1941346 RepID=UPI0009C47AFF|nr:hypothetical protein [Pseudomonas sp. VI4.1]OPK06124.1 hypothetical protein BZ163_33795 [Pseudomonas sp. VI4.1]